MSNPFTSTPTPSLPPGGGAISVTDPGDYDSVVGAYLAAMSIVIVYHMFALRTWLESVARAVEEVAAVERTSEPGALERADAAGKLKRVAGEFPLVQLAIVGSAVVVVGALALLAAARASLSFLFWGTPTIVLLLVLVASTAATWVRGRRMIREARSLLGVKE